MSQVVIENPIINSPFAESVASGIAEEFNGLAEEAGASTPPCLLGDAKDTACAPTPRLEIGMSKHIEALQVADALIHHDNRYAWVGWPLRRTTVRFGWDAVAFAEIRDLNRHRTGTKYCPLIPRGFYCALDQLPTSGEPDDFDALSRANSVGACASRLSLGALSQGDPTYIYWSVLGTQYRFEHVTTADKFIYEAELRTGIGAHFRYASHLRDVLRLWYERFPETQGQVLEGSAEPE